MNENIKETIGIITRNVKHIVFLPVEDDSPPTASHVSLLSLIPAYSAVLCLLLVLATFVCRNLNEPSPYYPPVVSGNEMGM